MEGGEAPSFEWDAFAPLLVHPMREAIVEALWWIAIPLSATDFRKVFRGKFTIGLINYHLITLAEARAIVKVRERPVRGGSVEKFYYFP